MEQEQISNWDEKKLRLQKDYPQLTQEDLVYEIGKELELLKKLQQKLNKTEKEIKGWLSMMG